MYGRGDYGNIFPKIKTLIARFMSDVVNEITDFLQGLKLSFNCPTDNDDEYDRCAKGAYARLIKAQGYIVKRVTEIICPVSPHVCAPNHPSSFVGTEPPRSGHH